MRELKFRGWHKTAKLMSNEATLQRMVEMDYSFSADDVVWLQFTGLHDKNGKEIYEGDVVSSVHFKDRAGRTHCLYHEVQWSEDFHGWVLLNCNSRSPKDGSIQLWIAKDEMEVIGNIYENPELLEAKDE